MRAEATPQSVNASDSVISVLYLVLSAIVFWFQVFMPSVGGFTLFVMLADSMIFLSLYKCTLICNFHCPYIISLRVFGKEELSCLIPLFSEYIYI